LDKQPIILLSFSRLEKDFIQSISDDITREFDCGVITKEITIDLSSYYNPGRRQYNANLILNDVSKITPDPSSKSIGLLREDLFIPILTYIFGQATLNGNIGIASLYRLRNELYGLEKNNALLNERFRKVVIHELGHMFGLIHCQNPICIMRSSTYVEDIDQKEPHLCIRCREDLQQKDPSF
jgi:archaemetzincin